MVGSVRRVGCRWHVDEHFYGARMDNTPRMAPIYLPQTNHHHAIMAAVIPLGARPLYRLATDAAIPLWRNSIVGILD